MSHEASKWVSGRVPVGEFGRGWSLRTLWTTTVAMETEESKSCCTCEERRGSVVIGGLTNKTYVDVLC